MPRLHTCAASLLALPLLGLAGCNPTRSDLRQKADQVSAAVFRGGSERSGQRIEPKFCKLDTAILSRPVGEKVVDASLWAVADEQWIAPETRQALEANGLRVGLISGDLPTDVNELFHPPAPQVKADWVYTTLPDGERTPVVIGDPIDSVTLFLNHKGKVDGRDYANAQGRLIITPRQASLRDVEIRVVPEIQHGEKRRTFGALEGGGQFAPQEFAMRDAQQEDLLRDLATTITMKPGQTLVIGCRPEQARTLGTFLFLHPESKTDRILQSVLIVQASRNNDGTPPLKVIEDDEPAVATPAASGATAGPAPGLPVSEPTPAKVLR